LEFCSELKQRSLLWAWTWDDTSLGMNEESDFEAFFQISNKGVSCWHGYGMTLART
jgi:hypothetical protein